MFFNCKLLSNVKQLFYFLLLATIFLPSLSFSENLIFKFEGFLENEQSGKPVNQTIKMKFSIIDKNGEPVWTRERYVSIKEGKLSVILGKVKPLKKIYFNGNYYISTVAIGNKKDQFSIKPKLILPQLFSNSHLLSSSDSLNVLSDTNNNFFDNTQPSTEKNIKEIEQNYFAVPLKYNPNEVSFSIYDDGENVGIGSNTPKVKLHVNGEIKIESTNIDCGFDVEGSMRYNKLKKEMEFCDGSIWRSFCNNCNDNNDVLKGIVAYYPLDNTANDQSENNNHGEQKNGVSFVDGFTKEALLCDGIDDYVHINNSAKLENPHITVQARVKSTYPGGSYNYIISKGANNCWASSFALYTGPSGGLYFYIFDNKSAVLSNDAGTKIWDNKWHHIVGTYDGKTVRLFVDGDEIGQGISTSIKINYNLPTTNNLFIGAYRGTCGNSNFFKGYIDNVAIWNRALDHSEIKSLCNTGIAKMYK